MKTSLLILLSIFVLTGCVQQSTSTKLQVTTSFYPLYFFTTQIAGDNADVYNITPAGAEPHDYDPTTQDLARIEDSRLLVLNGDKLEAWGDRMTTTLRDSSTIVITVGDSLATATNDPHVWLDPVLAKQEAAAIAQGLEQVDPSNTSTYQSNLQKLNQKFDQLNQNFITGLSNCAKTDIITSHSAFGYLAKQYQLNQISIAGLSPDAEPSAQQLADVADFAKQNNVTTIFFESLVSPKLSETIANEVGAQTMVLNPIEGLTDTDIAAGKTYFTEMEANLANLKIALLCT